MATQKGAHDDFFSMLSQDEPTQFQAGSSVSPNVVVFKDADGTMKQLVNGVVEPLVEDSTQQEQQRHVKNETTQSHAPKKEQVSKTSHKQPVVQQVAVPNIPKYEPKLANPLQEKQFDRAAQLAQTVEKEVSIMFADSQLRSRFEKLLLSYIKGIRSRVQLKDTLGRDVTLGGIGLDQAKISQVLQALDTHHTPARTAVSVVPQQEIVAPTIEFAKQVVRKPTPEAQRQIDTLIAGGVPAITAPKPLSLRVVQQNALGKKVVEPVVQSQPVPAQPKQRPKIADVVFKPKAMGPIEELQSFSLKDFRNLASTADAAAQKIEEKIMLLEKESFSKRFEAIKAWHQSQVYQLYVEIGHESIGGAHSVEQVIAQHQEKQEPTLTLEEFEAVSELNRRLRF